MHFVRLADGVRDNAAAAYAAPHASFAHIPLWAPASDNWVPLSASDFKGALEANALEGGYVLPASSGGNAKGEKAAIVLVKQLTVTREDGDEAAREAWRQWLLHDVGVAFGDKTYTYGDLCFGSKCADAPQFDAHPLHAGQATLTMFLRAPAHDTPSLTYLNYVSHLPSFTAPGTNTTLRVQSVSPSGNWGLLPSLDPTIFAGLGQAKAAAEDEQNPAVRKVRWIAYAARVLVVRFYTLAKVSSGVCGDRQNGQTQKLTTPIRTPTLRTSSSCCWVTSSCTPRLCTCSSTCASSDPVSGSVSDMGSCAGGATGAFA